MQILPIEVRFIDKNHSAFKAMIDAVILDSGVYIPIAAKHDGRTFKIVRINSDGTLNYAENVTKK